MYKKIFLGVALVGIIGVLVFGAVTRTIAKTDGAEQSTVRQQLALNDTAQSSNAGNGPGWRQTDPTSTPDGTVDQAGSGNRYGQAQANTGQSAQAQAGGKGYGRSRQQEGANTGGRGYGRGARQQDQSGERALQASQLDRTWSEVSGVVTAVDDTVLVIETADGETIEITNRPWWFAQEGGFTASVGDEVTVYGFEQAGVFEAGSLQNDTSGQSTQIRDESGRPLWAGGQGRGRSN